VHPDRDTGDVESFVRLREAYETLRDSREMYDRTYAVEAEERRVERVRLAKKIAVGGFVALAAISIFFSGKILTSWYMTQSPQIDPIKYRDRLELARRRQQERFDQSRKAKKKTAAKKKLR
jgi:curved DNA-binding protein CbpA